MGFSDNMKPRLAKFAGRNLSRLINHVRKTSQVVYDPPDLLDRLRRQHPAIIAVWHGQFMMTIGFRPGDEKVYAMVARHGDAELIGAAMAEMGINLIRGAGAGDRKKDRGGMQALRAAVRALNDGGSVAMTADVPPGPARNAGIGIVTLARLAGRPIVPVASATSRFRALRTWSRLTINLPYSKLAYVAGEPIHVPPDANAETLERLRREVEDRLNAATRRAYALAGADIMRATPLNSVDPDSPPAAAGLSLKTYRAASRMLRPFTPLLLGVRERAGKEEPARRPERFGIAGHARPDGPLVWIHAASVGETNAVLPLIQKLGDTRRDLRFLLTTGTITSARLAARRLDERAIHQFIPLDSPQYVARFLEHWRPDLAVFTESEIWPNLILESSDRRIPLLLINGRMSRRSFERWKRTPGTSAPLFSRFNLVLAQNRKLARWFGELGARSVMAVGNLKIDAPPPPVDALEFERLKTAVGGRPLFVAASTHEGEEEIVGAAHRLIAHAAPGLITIIAPRHPERGKALAEHFRGNGLNVAQRSLGHLPDETTEIYIADTIGELGALYALAPVAFVGGSLIEHGGQNPIEPVRHGAAVLTGPHWQNFRDAYEQLIGNRGALQIKSAEDLAREVSRLLTNPADLDRMRLAATRALDDLAGALDSTAKAVIELLPPGEGLKRAS
jgi:3-deoxy-D-manno-octulosonic-acid transferase